MTNNLDQLDDIDKKIIKNLQVNSRISVVDIARDIDELTENAIRYRIDRLESEGYISDYTIRLNSKKFGKNIIAIFSLNVMPENINTALDNLESLDCLTDVYLTTGSFSIIAIGYFADSFAVSSFITENLKNIQMVDYDVITVLKKIKQELYNI